MASTRHEETADRERPRRSHPVGLLAGPLLFLAVLATPLPALGWEAHALVAIYTWTVVYWITEAIPIPVTAMLSSLLAVTLGVASARTVFSSYGDPVIFLFIGSFMLAEAMRSSGLDRRFAFAVLGLGWATRSPARLLLAIGVVTATISLAVSNTATTAIMLPVGRGMLTSLGPAGDTGRSRYPVGFMLMLTSASSVAVGLPVASPPNLIAIGMLDELASVHITFFQWALVTMPLTGAMLALCWLLLRSRYPAPRGSMEDVRTFVQEERAAFGPWTPAQRNVAAVFALIVTLWMLPGAAASVAGSESSVARWLDSHLPESAVALLAPVLLCALPTDLRRGEFTLTWKRAAQIDWGTILLFGGGLALGSLTFETGLASVISTLSFSNGMRSHWTVTWVPSPRITSRMMRAEPCSRATSTPLVVVGAGPARKSLNGRPRICSRGYPKKVQPASFV